MRHSQNRTCREYYTLIDPARVPATQFMSVFVFIEEYVTTSMVHMGEQLSIAPSGSDIVLIRIILQH